MGLNYVSFMGVRKLTKENGIKLTQPKMLDKDLSRGENLILIFMTLSLFCRSVVKNAVTDLLFPLI